MVKIPKAHPTLLEDLIFEAIGRNVPQLFGDLKNITFDNYFEGIVLGWYLSTLVLANKMRTESEDFSVALSCIIAEVAFRQQVLDKFDGGYPEFIANRFLLYEKCFTWLINKTYVNKAASIISFNLYVSPLQKFGQTDSVDIWKFSDERMVDFMAIINDAVDDAIRRVFPIPSFLLEKSSFPRVTSKELALLPIVNTGIPNQVTVVRNFLTGLPITTFEGLTDFGYIHVVCLVEDKWGAKNYSAIIRGSVEQLSNFINKYAQGGLLPGSISSVEELESELSPEYTIQIDNKCEYSEAIEPYVWKVNGTGPPYTETVPIYNNYREKIGSRNERIIRFTKYVMNSSEAVHIVRNNDNEAEIKEWLMSDFTWGML